MRTLALGLERPLRLDGVDWTPAATPAELDAPSAGALLVDSYVLGADDLATLAEAAPLAVLHDFGDHAAAASLVIDVGAAGEDSRSRLCGPRYACLRSMFWGVPERTVRETVSHVVVSTGGGDLGSASTALAETTRDALSGARVSLIRGPYAEAEPPAGVEVIQSPEHPAAILATADLAVTAAGQTLLEAAAMGTPSIAVPVVENQRRNALRLAEGGAVRLVEQAGAPLAAALGELAEQPRLRRELAIRAQAAVDGFGALRVAFRLEQLAGERA